MRQTEKRRAKCITGNRTSEVCDGGGGGAGGANPQDSGGYRWTERGIEKQRDEERDRKMER